MTDYQVKTPVVLLIFNRPDLTTQVFKAVRQTRPAKLFVVADGPRPSRPEDAEKCAMTRAILNQIDWDCEVKTCFSETNLGCKNRVSSGLDWVFQAVEEAIILEDDCVPHPTFFRFCDELLEYYRCDRRVMVIAGNNFQFGRKRTNDSYYFSRYNHCWGWATWRRAWCYYDNDMKLWPNVKEQNWLQDILDDRKAVKTWRNIFQSVYENSVNSWALRWTFACWLQSGLTVLPNVNLVSNIGFGTEASHTTDKSSLANLPVDEMAFPLRHPPFMIRNHQADQFTQKYIFQQSLRSRLQQKLKKILSRIP